MFDNSSLWIEKIKCLIFHRLKNVVFPVGLHQIYNFYRQPDFNGGNVSHMKKTPLLGDYMEDFKCWRRPFNIIWSSFKSYFKESSNLANITRESKMLPSSRRIRALQEDYSLLLCGSAHWNSRFKSTSGSQNARNRIRSLEGDLVLKPKREQQQKQGLLCLCTKTLSYALLIEIGYLFFRWFEILK